MHPTSAGESAIDHGPLRSGQSSNEPSTSAEGATRGVCQWGLLELQRNGTV